MSNLNDVVSRLEQIAIRLERHLGQNNSSDSNKSSSQHLIITDFDALVDGDLSQFVSLSDRIGGPLSQMSQHVLNAFKAQKIFISKAISASSKPNQAEIQQLLTPVSQIISQIEDLRNKNRSDKLFNHLSAISESIGALAWVCQEPAPGPYVKEMLAASQFYLNRVLKDYKGVDNQHVEWVQAWTRVLTALGEYIKQHHTTGLSWCAAPGTAVASAPAAAGGPPPPPPPPPADLLLSVGGGSSSSSGGDDARSALFSQLNRADAVTSGLRKVTPDMQTHKNPELRGTKAVPPPTAPKPGSAGKPNVAVAPAKPPKMELVSNKWIVENFKNKTDIIIPETENKQTVYIFKCEGCYIQVKGKINSIVMDNCKKTGLAFDDLISALDIVNCQSVKAQVMGKLPTVNIDKTDGCQIYLSKESVDSQIVTAKSSEMNILIPKGDGDFDEFPVPEQFKTHYDGTSLVTSCSEKIA